MATPVWVNEGLVQWQKFAMGVTGSPTFTVGLFKTSVSVTVATVFGDLTEADFSGYSNWSPSFSTPTYQSSPARSESTDSTGHDFVHNGGGTSNTIYGCFLAYLTGSVLLAAMTFDSPINMAVNADTIHIVPTIFVDQ